MVDNSYNNVKLFCAFRIYNNNGMDIFTLGSNDEKIVKK